MNCARYVKFFESLLKSTEPNKFINKFKDKIISEVQKDNIGVLKLAIRHLVFTRARTQDDCQLIAKTGEDIFTNVVKYSDDINGFDKEEEEFYWSCFSSIESKGRNKINHVKFLKEINEELSRLIDKKVEGNDNETSSLQDGFSFYNYENPEYDRR